MYSREGENSMTDHSYSCMWPMSLLQQDNILSPHTRVWYTFSDYSITRSWNRLFSMMILSASIIYDTHHTFSIQAKQKIYLNRISKKIERKMKWIWYAPSCNTPWWCSWYSLEAICKKWISLCKIPWRYDEYFDSAYWCIWWKLGFFS